MALSKIQAESMNLADTYAFSGTVSGAGGGKILQVVQGGRTSRVTHNTTTFTDVGVSANIIPSSTSSNILIILTGAIGNSNASNYTMLKLFRDSTEIGSGTGGTNASVNNFVVFLQEANSGYHTAGFAQQFLDEDVSTTSQVTYKIQMAGQNGIGSLGGRGDSADAAVPTRLILMEVSG